MKNLKKITAQALMVVAILFVFYVGYLFMMVGEWYKFERFASSLFEGDLKNAPTLTIKSVSGGFLSWSREVELENGLTIYFHRDKNPSAWRLEKGDEIAVFISPSELEKNKSAFFCGAFEKR